MKTTQRWIISLKAPFDRQMPGKLTGIYPSDSVQIGTGENRSRKQCRQFGVKMAPCNARKNENGSKISRTSVPLYEIISRYGVRTYGLFHVQISAENACANGLWNGVCHRSKQGKTKGFSARRRGVGGFWGTSPIPLAYACRNQSISITVYHYILKDRQLNVAGLLLF